MDEAYETEVRGRTTSALALIRQAHTELDEQLDFLKEEAKRCYSEAAAIGKTYSAKERHWTFLTKPRKAGSTTKRSAFQTSVAAE